MKLPVSWLREWVEVPWAAPELARRLTSAGFEVESSSAAAPAFEGVVVAQILEAVPHPQADKLQICSVSTGQGAPLTIVCGAPNARAGLVSALATVGAHLPGDKVIAAATLRGVMSEGMLCSARELGLEAGGEGILELPDDARLGVNLREALALDDIILDLSITPNRGDAMSVLGIAREIAALTGRPLKWPTLAPVPAAHADRLALTLQPGAGAARFTARILRGLTNGASPTWLRERLRRAGLRAISAVVDVTNYVLLELGQPLHAYDLAQIKGPLAARRAQAGETLRLLDGRELTLESEDLVIADADGPVGLAGIMGGERSAISADSRDIVLESAWFKPDAIGARARRYGLQTDASQRFERGVDANGQERALERATALLLEITGGSPGAVSRAELPAELPRFTPVPLRGRQIERLLGAPVPAAQVEQRLRALQMTVTGGGGSWLVMPPPWRFDIGIEADLIEEVVRLGGLDTIPEHDAHTVTLLASVPSARVAEPALREALSARGYQEVITFGFVDPALQGQLFGEAPAIELANPIAADLAVLRRSLWPGLISVARENLRRQQQRLRLFEIARRFVPEAEGRIEQPTLALLAGGTRLPEQWGVAAAAVDVFDLKADLEALLALGGRAHEFSFEPASLPCLHPGRSARIRRSGTQVGWLGELHPKLVRSLELTYAPLLLEIDWEAVSGAGFARFQEISRYPSIRRDISFTVPDDTAFSLIHERVSVAASSLLKELRVFDIYQGRDIESGRKSVALGLIFQDLNRTLADADADRLIAAVLTDLRTNLDARIRE